MSAFWRNLVDLQSPLWAAPPKIPISNFSNPNSVGKANQNDGGARFHYENGISRQVSAKVPIPERILQMLGSLFGLLPLGGIVNGIPKFYFFSFGTLFSLVNLGLLAYSSYCSIIGDSESEWIAADDSSVLERFTTSFIAMKIYVAATMIGFGCVVFVALLRAKKLESMLQKYLRTRAIAESFGWDSGNGLPELLLFIICAIILDISSYILWERYWANGWKFIEYSFYIMSVYVLFLSCTMLRSCKLFLRHLNRIFDESVGPNSKTAAGFSRISPVGQLMGAGDPSSRAASVLFSCYILVFELCDDFSKLCGLPVAVVCGLNFVYIVTWINNVTVFVADPSVVIPPSHVAAYSAMTGIYAMVLLFLNVNAQGILDEDDILRVKIRNIGAPRVFPRRISTVANSGKSEEDFNKVKEAKFTSYFDGKVCDTLDRILSHRPIAVTADGYFDLRKGNLTNMLSLTITFVIILMQFQISELSTKSTEDAITGLNLCSKLTTKTPQVFTSTTVKPSSASTVNTFG